MILAQVCTLISHDYVCGSQSILLACAPLHLHTLPSTYKCGDIELFQSTFVVLAMALIHAIYRVSCRAYVCNIMVIGNTVMTPLTDYA